ncbi:hypothetical protein BDV95DRAFT_602800 [Massariosphaeria phaeospora]|uniref:Uncharacterized protein n=1 Tax=Massariosphaeria phaeospora TaxID=100035 RepID=A0A7C8MGB1_9PLEO|nr:hypothetical protein BDV95DRAFT_602800 [Massariosphaeria phaeospora]
MSTLFDCTVPSPFLDEDPYKRIRGLQQNCLLAPHCDFQHPPPHTLEVHTSNPDLPFSFRTNTPTRTSASVSEPEYFNLTSSRPNTPLYTPLSTPPSSPSLKPAPLHFHLVREPTAPRSQIRLSPFGKQDAEATAIVYERALEHDGAHNAVMRPSKMDPETPFEEQQWRAEKYERALMVSMPHIVKAIDEITDGSREP